jgi:glycosyltransferase involved in cell wall biosynthesis
VDKTGSGVAPRVVFLLPSFAGGGAERVVLTFLAGLDRGLFCPELVVLDGKGPLAEMVPADVLVHDLQRTRLRYAMARLLATLRRLRPAVIVSTLGYVNLALLAFRVLLTPEPRILVREANTPSQSLRTTPSPFLFRLGYRLLYPRADGVLCPSRLMMAEMSRDFAVPLERLHYLANPIDEARIRQAAVAPRRVPGPGLRFVAAGRLTLQKGFDRVIELLDSMPEETHVTILGNGPQSPILKALAARHGVEKRVHWAGFDPSPWPVYAGADAFLLPSRWEGMPNAALEALACGTRVIATPESGGMLEVAAEAVPGAVTVTEVGEPFLKAMRAVVPDPCRVPRPSLLPQRFSLEAANSAFAAILTMSIPACAPPAGTR